jgi:hypothetical protein
MWSDQLVKESVSALAGTTTLGFDGDNAETKKSFAGEGGLEKRSRDPQSWDRKIGNARVYNQVLLN